MYLDRWLQLPAPLDRQTHRTRQRRYRQYPTHQREDIPKTGIEGKVVIEPIPHCQRRELMPRRALRDAAIRIDRRRHPRVRVPQQPAPVLYRTHACHIQVLPRRAGISIPSIVRDIHQHFGTIHHKMSYLICKNRLVADKYPVVMSMQPEHRTLPPMREASRIPGQPMRKAKELCERHILAPRNPMYLRVASHERTIRTKDTRGVV